MNLNFPRVQIPEFIALVCQMNLKNSRSCFAKITELIDNDPFLKLYVQQLFPDHLKKGGFNLLLSNLGWEGFRNRMAEAYIEHGRYHKFPSEISLDEVNDIIDFEKRFDFLYPEGNSRVFQLGMFLKLCDIYQENSFDFDEQNYVVIPSEVDEILILGKSKSLFPDWLIISVWTLFNILGDDRAKLVFDESKGRLSHIKELLSEDEFRNFFSVLLKYGHGVHDHQIFISSRV